MPRAGLSYRGKLRLSTTSQSASQTAPLVGEPLAKPFTLRGLPRPLPLGEVARHRRDGEGKPGTKEHLHSDKHWLLIESSYRCIFVLSQHPCPLRRYAPAPPKGEPLAGRATSYWTPEARYGAKGRALLQRAAASGQAHLVKLP